MGGGASTNKSDEKKQADAAIKKIESKSDFQKKSAKVPAQVVNYRSYAVTEHENSTQNYEKRSPGRDRNAGNVIPVPSVVVASAAVAAVVPRRLFEPDDEIADSGPVGG